MKSEHRHELKTNDLERIASGFRRVSGSYAERHTSELIIAVVILIAIGIGVALWLNSGSSAERQGWEAMAGANSAADYANVADKFPGTNVAQWARLREGEAHFFSGLRLMFSDRDAGRSDIKKAEECFDKLVSDKATRDDVLERALFELGGCRETLSGKNTDPAIETYDRLLKRFPGSMYHTAAEARVAALRTGSAEDFYAWFQSQNPKPRDREIPSDIAIPAEPSAPSKDGKTPPTTDALTIPPAPSSAPSPKDAPKDVPVKPAKPSASAPKVAPGATSGAAPAKNAGPALPAPSGR